MWFFSLGYETDKNRKYWWILDYTSDLLYLVDILLVKSRVQFINNGMLEVSTREKETTHWKLICQTEIQTFQLCHFLCPLRGYPGRNSETASYFLMK